MKMNETARLIVFNGELKNAINGFIEDLVKNNDIPWFMVENALMAIKDSIADRVRQELNDALVVMEQQSAAVGSHMAPAPEPAVVETDAVDKE